MLLSITDEIFSVWFFSLQNNKQRKKNQLQDNSKNPFFLSFFLSFIHFGWFLKERKKERERKGDVQQRCKI